MNVKHSFDVVKQIDGISLKAEDTIISYDAVDLFASIPPSSAIDVVHQALLENSTLTNRTNLHCNKICDLLHLCLNNTS